ncbi:MAG: alpha-amylase family protein [Vicinamibacteraceae bacterium]
MNERDTVQHLSRRQFLAGAVVTTASSFSPPAAGAVQELQDDDAPSRAGWFDRPMRWAQLTLVENDPGRYDPRFWLDYFKRLHADAACLSAGGCVAYYPTRIPLHHRSAWMGEGDPFNDLLTGCRQLGMVVIARTDPHAVHQDVYDAHPDWIAVDAEGHKRQHWASPEMWVSCALGPYAFDFMTEVHEEIVSRYQVDGIFSNRWSGSGMCYCEHCGRNFKTAAGLDLPRTSNPQDPARRAYIVWRQERLFELWRVWDQAIRRQNPNARFIANAGGGALSSLDMKTIGELAPTLFADRQARRGLAAPWSNGKAAKEYRATLGRKATAGIFSVGVEEPYRWKDSVQSEAEIRIWVAEGTANGTRPWFTKFGGTLYDRRWLEPVAKIYEWHHQHERYLRNDASLARVALVYSQQTGTFYGGERADEKVEDHILGFYHALVEARVPFEMVHDRLLDEAHLRPYKLLILPNIAALSDAQCDQLRAFVAGGGSIIATFETSRYDEWGVRRADFGLADLFGARWKKGPDGPQQNSYLTVEIGGDSTSAHPVLAGLEDAGRIINGVHWIDVARLEGTLDPPLTLVPSYPDLPMEKVFPRVPHTDIPALVLREQGASRVAYFPWDIDRTFWEVMCVDHGRLLRNVVRWATNEPPPVIVSGRGLIDVTIWRQRSSITVHLVNLTNPMTMKGPYRELVPLSAQRVQVRVPEATRAKEVRLLVHGGTPPVARTDGGLELTVPSILDHEVVAIDL